MLSDTLKKEFARYAIGEKVRALRWQRKLRLVELAALTGLSPALLSKIERGNSIPSLQALSAIATAFEVKLSHFFPKPRRCAPVVTRKRERIRLPESVDGKDTAYDFECLNFPVSEPQINCYHAEFSANLRPRHHAHEGMEFLYVTTGQLAIAFPEEEVLLSAGDSVCFDSSAPHAYRKAGAESCTALVVTYPTARAAEAVTAADMLRLHTREVPWKRAS